MNDNKISDINYEIPIYKDYIINNENKIYNLRIEINKQNILYFTLKNLNINDKIDYIYKKELKSISLVENLKLNSSNFAHILESFDTIYQNKNISISIIDNDHINLIIKNKNIPGDCIYEILLNKEYMSIDDKLNVLYRHINLIENEKIKILNKDMNKKEDDIKNILNEKDIIITEMNQKLMIQDKLLKEHRNEIDTLNKKIEEIKIKFEEELKQKEDKINRDILNEKDKLLNKINDNYNEIKGIIDDIYYNLNKKMNNNIIEIELKELMRNNTLSRFLFIKDYNFKKEPQKLKYKKDITSNNDHLGVNDIFEVFISCKDLIQYIISPNIDNYNLDIYILKNNKKVTSLSGHNNHITTIKYYLNSVSFNEYLISGDTAQIVIIWDVTNDYDIKYKINTEYGNNSSIFSCLLAFPYNYSHKSNYSSLYIDDYIITSSRYLFNDIDKSGTKVYSLTTGKFIKTIKNSNKYSVYYLLFWLNKKNNKFYIIQLAEKIIVINNLLEDELYCELKSKQEDSHYSGFIYNKGDNDYLFSTSYNGKIDIWDLYNKKIYQVILLNKCNLFHIMQWNQKYIIVSDYKNISFKVIDLRKNKVVADIKGEHKKYIKCIKKLLYYKVECDTYKEYLITCGNDKIIKLWGFDE